MDRLVYRLSDGRFTAVSLLGGLPMITLTTTGAKSGRKCCVPLIAIPDGDNVLLIASNWGKKRHPAWYYNLRANARVEVEMGGEKGDFIACEAADAEYDAYWGKAVSIFGGYDAYKERTGGREIPIIVLTPAESS
jgi:deazaflavin-dependent oxidoreductase (nitroreductase family)